MRRSKTNLKTATLEELEDECMEDADRLFNIYQI